MLTGPSDLITAWFSVILCPAAAYAADAYSRNSPSLMSPLFMAQQPSDSLGGQNTFSGPLKKPTGPQSLGDQNTFSGGSSGGGDTDFGDDLEIVDLSARYTMGAVLGKGGMGEVLLATDNRLNRKVAIKRMLGEGTKSRTAVSRFLTEAKSIAALNHTNIVQIYDYGRDKSGPFLILEFVDGCSLLDLCRDGAMPLERAVDLISQLSDGLSIAHDARIIHRDIKPANVLLTKTGIPKLTDFGLAKDEAGDSGLSMAGAVLGTLDFMPPEQRNDAALVDSRSDLWSLAATLYQMVTGELPRVIDLDLVPQALRPALAKALKAKKDDRYQTAREFKEALRASLQDTGPALTGLGEGQCVHCGTKNEGHRKFCKECAVTLRVQCFSCSIEIPVWDKVCSECGTRQAELLESRRKAMTGQQSQAESLLKNYDFDQATTLAVALRDEPDPRLQQLTGWSKQFLEEIASGRQQQLERIGKLLSEALQHEHAYDYSSGIQTLEQVPTILRGTTIHAHSLTPETLLKQLTEKYSEVHRLDELIRQRGEARQHNGLLKEVDSLLKLCPDRSDLQTLKEQLVARDVKLITTRDEAFAAARQLLSSQDYPGAIEELDRIDPYVLQPEMSALREEAKSFQSRLQTLQKTIATAVEQEELDGLLKIVDDCLLLKAGDAELEKLRDRLIKREGKNAPQMINKAKGLRSGCQFASASQALQRIREELQTQEVLDLMSECDEMAIQRESALAALQSSMQCKRYEEGLRTSSVYRNAISMGDQEDNEFETQYRACQQALDAERKATSDAERQKKLLFGLGIGAVVLVLLLLMMMLFIESSMRAAAEVRRQAEVAAAAEKQRQAEVAAAAAEKQRQADIAAAAEKQRQAEVAAAAAEKQRQADIAAAAEKQRQLALPPFHNSQDMEFKLLPGGPDGTYSIGVYEVTQSQYEAVMGRNPSKFEGANNPVENVSWDDAVAYCAKLSSLPAERAAGRVYRLPTAAEWEYACRAGTTTEYSFGDDAKDLGKYAWFGDNSGNTTHAVGEKLPNVWGLYDMHGNIWEWCSDEAGSFGVYRGGSWFNDAALCRTAFRSSNDPWYRSYNYGFRLALSSPSVQSPEADK